MRLDTTRRVADPEQFQGPDMRHPRAPMAATQVALPDLNDAGDQAGWPWGDENLVLTADCVLPGFVAHRPDP